MKKSRKLLFVLGGMIVLLLLLPVSMHYRAKARLAAYKKEFLAAGEKLAISELAPTPNAQGQRNAAALLHAANTLTSIDDFFPNGMKVIKPGRARVAWRQAELNQEIDPPGIFTNVWPLMRAAPTNDEETLTEIRGILSADNIQFPLDYQQADFFSSWVDHLTMGKRLALRSGAEVILDLRDGRTNEALENLLLSVAVPKLCVDEPLMISQLVRYAEMAVAVPSCWETLQFKGWTDEQLAQLQKQWEALDFLSEVTNSLAMERARLPMDFDRSRRSREAMDAMPMSAIPYAGLNNLGQHVLENPREGARQLMQATVAYPRYWVWSAIWSFDDERLNMQLYQEMIETIRAAQQRRAVLGQLKEEVINGEPMFFRLGDGQSKYEITDNVRPMVKKYVVGALRAQTQVEIVTAAIALERYSLRYHKYPTRLDDLVPSFVGQVPIDYIDGKDLRYRLRPDGSFLLYSVGRDGVDDGGDPTPPVDKWPGFLNGRDWVWPGVATEQEVSDYEAGEAKKAAQKQAEVRKPRRQ